MTKHDMLHSSEAYRSHVNFCDHNSGLSSKSLAGPGGKGTGNL